MAKRSFAQRYHTARTAIVHRARRHGTEGAKTLAIGGVVGALAEKAATFAAKNSTWVAGHWYGTPAVLAGAAYLAAKKFPKYAQALAGAAGFAGMYAYDMSAGSVKPAATTGPGWGTEAPDDAVNF